MLHRGQGDVDNRGIEDDHKSSQAQQHKRQTPTMHALRCGTRSAYHQVSPEYHFLCCLKSDNALAFSLRPSHYLGHPCGWRYEGFMLSFHIFRVAHLQSLFFDMTSFEA